MKKIEVLGTGCPSCEKAYNEINKAVQGLGWTEGADYSLEKVQDTVQIVQRGIFMTPGIVVDGKVMSSGKVPRQGQILDWLK